jgi:hypothetical protein
MEAQTSKFQDDDDDDDDHDLDGIEEEEKNTEEVVKSASCHRTVFSREMVVIFRQVSGPMDSAVLRKSAVMSRSLMN